MDTTVNNVLENVGADVRLVLERDSALMRGWSVAGEDAVLAIVHEENKRLRDVCRERLIARYAAK